MIRLKLAALWNSRYVRFGTRAVLAGCAAFFSTLAAGAEVSKAALYGAVSAGLLALLGSISPWEPNVGVEYPVQDGGTSYDA